MTTSKTPTEKKTVPVKKVNQKTKPFAMDVIEVQVTPDGYKNVKKGSVIRMKGFESDGSDEDFVIVKKQINEDKSYDGSYYCYTLDTVKVNDVVKGVKNQKIHKWFVDKLSSMRDSERIAIALEKMFLIGSVTVAHNPAVIKVVTPEHYTLS